MTPARNPLTAVGPNSNPPTIGVNITRTPGAIIFFNEAFVAIAMHLL